MKNLLKNNINLLKIVFICISFFIISFLAIKNKLSELEHQVQNNLGIIEIYIDSQISNANHVIYSLTATLIHDFQLKDKKRIQEILDIFDPQLKYAQFPPFAGYKVLGPDNEIIALTFPSMRPFIKYKTANDPAYLDYIKNIKKEPFKLYVAPIRPSRERGVEMIPMGMSMINNEKQYIGSFVTGLLTDKLNEKLNKLSSSLVDIQLHNWEDKDKFQNYIEKPKLNLTYLLSRTIKNKPITIIHTLSNFPFLIVKAILNPNQLNQALNKTILFGLGYFLIFSFFVYLLWSTDYRLYNKLLKRIKNKLDELPGIESKIDKIANIKFNKGLTSEDLANIISGIIETYYNLYQSYEKSKAQRPMNEIEGKVLQLLLTEIHYYPAYRSHNKHHISELYINQLKNFINEQPKTSYLSEFLKEITEYCSEYYYELNICLLPIKNDKTFSFKHVALCETIFNIFILILRIGQFNTDTEQVIVKGFFNDSNNNFPTITIEASIVDSASIHSVGWSSGVSYIYSSLFTIYLLAKENNLIFYVEQIEQKILFKIEPISEDRFEAAENCILKYIRSKK